MFLFMVCCQKICHCGWLATSSLQPRCARTYFGGRSFPLAIEARGMQRNFTTAHRLVFNRPCLCIRRSVQAAAVVVAVCQPADDRDDCGGDDGVACDDERQKQLRQLVAAAAVRR